jgi:hypothetical protein
MEEPTLTTRLIKDMIARGNLVGVQECYAEIKAEDEGDVDWPSLFKDCYLHACLTGQGHIRAWFEEVFTEFDPISQIALRQVFAYGRHLERRARHLKPNTLT